MRTREGPSGPRLGNQSPTFEVVDDWHHTFGPNCSRMFEGWGVRFYPSQRHELDVLLARDGRNRFACRTICITKPRQNGKSFAVRFYAIWMAAVEHRNVLFTAHRGKTVRRMFKFMRAFVLHTPDLAEKLLPGADGVYKAAGSEGIYFSGGGMIEFATRTDGGGRGETYDVIVFDEAQELTDEQYDAIVPTTIASESGDPQKIYLGTPPGPKCQGTVFRAQHDKAHSSECSGIWWIEWSVTQVPDMGDPRAVLELVYQTNPAMGYRIREDVMLDVITGATSPDGFAREFLNWWAPSHGAVNPVIGTREWEACRDKSPKKDGALSLAVRFSPDGRGAAVAACYQAADATPFVYVVRHQSVEHGMGWIVDLLLPTRDKAKVMVIDGQAHAKALGERLLAEGVSRRAVMVAKSTDASAAYSGFVDKVREGRLRHFGQPALDRSATGSERRIMGKAGGWGFESTEEADATLVEACCWAVWGQTATRRNPTRKGRAGC